jgi:hypothetical protein
MPYVIEPLVAGELGDGTDLDPSTHPPRVSSVEYVLDAPVEEDLIESFPVFLVSEELERRIQEAGLRGISLEDARVVPSPEYIEIYGDAPHKQYRWMKLDQAEDPDAWLGEDLRLNVTDRMMEMLQSLNISNADVEPVEPA